MTIACAICGEAIHSVQVHLTKAHPGMTLQDYQATYPGQPVLSQAAIEHLRAKGVQAPGVTPATPTAAAPATPHTMSVTVTKKALHELFALPDSTAVRNGRGDPIPVSVLSNLGEFAMYVPEVDEGHVWEIENLKNMLLAVETDIPLYVWGHKGTGKTTALEQVAARTGRPVLRIQHTINTEESHIVGQWTVKDGETVFELGPLPLAMKYGWVYLADEYDFALASVLSVYQPVLEGKALIIKQADAQNRVIKPHPNFRFWATGNTNGTGDESGLYQGTSVQNAANYDRFGMVIEAQYMPPAQEAIIIRNRTGISVKEAEKLVSLATAIRREFAAGKLGDTVSTRALVNAAKIGLKRGNMRLGVQLAYSNKLSRVDKTVVDGVAQRELG
jgi:cobaltochelatase CobS